VILFRVELTLETSRRDSYLVCGTIGGCLSVQIAEAIGIVRDVLEQNHPDAVVKKVEGESGDFQLSTVGATVIVRSPGGQLTDGDINDIEAASEDRLDDKRLAYYPVNSEMPDSAWLNLRD
jgi:hypothetical protein